jgi:hypothetical protein
MFLPKLPLFETAGQCNMSTERSAQFLKLSAVSGATDVTVRGKEQAYPSARQVLVTVVVLSLALFASA